MDTRAIAKEYRLTEWTGIISDQKASGLSVRVYCETAGIHENQYYYWQRKLREAACEGLIKTNLPISTTQMVPNGWTRCEIIKPKPENEAPLQSALSIDIGKCRVNVGVGVDGDVLTAVCRTLITLC